MPQSPGCFHDGDDDCGVGLRSRVPSAAVRIAKTRRLHVAEILLAPADNQPASAAEIDKRRFRNPFLDRQVFLDDALRPRASVVCADEQPPAVGATLAVRAQKAHSPENNPTFTAFFVMPALCQNVTCVPIVAMFSSFRLQAHCLTSPCKPQEEQILSQTKETSDFRQEIISPHVVHSLKRSSSVTSDWMSFQ